MTDRHKELINDIISMVATEIARSGKPDLYELQDYLGSFDAGYSGLTYPDGTTIDMASLRGEKL